MHHTGIDLAKAQRVQQIGADGGEAHSLGIRSRARHQIEHKNVVGVAQRGDTDGPVFQILQRANLFRHLRRAGEGEQRQSSGGRKARDLRSMGECLECHVEGRARVVHRTTDQSLHSDVPTARIDQAHVEAFVGKVAARSRNLVGDNAKELAAECEQYLTALAVGIFLGDKHDAAGQSGQSLQSRSSADDFTITAIFEFAGELGRQFFAAIH